MFIVKFPVIVVVVVYATTSLVNRDEYNDWRNTVDHFSSVQFVCCERGLSGTTLRRRATTKDQSCNRRPAVPRLSPQP